MWPWRVKMQTQNFLRLLLLLMLMLRIMLQIWELKFGPKTKLLFRLWAQGLVNILKLKFRQDFEAGICSAFCRWCFVEVMKLNHGRDAAARFGQDFEFWVYWRCWCLVEIFNWCLVEILKMKCDQDLYLNLWNDLKKLLWQDEPNPWVRCAFGNVYQNTHVAPN